MSFLFFTVVNKMSSSHKRNFIDLTGDTESEADDDNDEEDLLKGILDPTKGYAVLPFPPHIRESFNLDLFLQEQREFTTQDKNQLFVLGGFGALANPSSFHHPERRKLLQDVFAYMFPMFGRLFEGTDYEYLSMIPDRFAIRRNDQQVGSETWHKDVSFALDSNNMIKNAMMFGGWINLDANKSQFFSCVPGDVILPGPESEQFYERTLQGKGGFSAIDGEKLTEKSERIEVPPNHLIVFNELLTHEVAKGGTKTNFDPNKTSYRCFLKWYVSKTATPYWGVQRMESFFNRQSQIGMSLSQPDAPMFASAHQSTSIPLLEMFSDRVIPELRTNQLNTKAAGVKRGLIHRYLGQGGSKKPSEGLIREGLVDWNLAFPPYTEQEKAIYRSQQMFSTSSSRLDASFYIRNNNDL